MTMRTPVQGMLADTLRVPEFSRFLRKPSCPHCRDALLAPDHTEFVSDGEIRHYWSCETCGLVSQTSVGQP